MTAISTWWVVVNKDYSPDEMFGPYETEADAVRAMDYAPAVDYSCQEDCLDAWVEEHLWHAAQRRFKHQPMKTYMRSTFHGRDVIVIDPHDLDFTGSDFIATSEKEHI